MDLEEYIEKTVADGYKQQMADEENVPRSLPFFATALAVLVAIVGVVREVIPPFAWDPYSVIIWIMLGCLSVALMMVLLFLQRAVRKRDFRYAMDEVALRHYVADLQAYYALDTSLTAEDRQAAISADVRAALTAQYADAATANRTNNFARASARATALSSLVLALFFAFAMIAIILVHEKS